MDEIKNGKIERVLGIYTKLINGELINKSQEALEYGVNERSIQRDIDDVRDYLENSLVKEGILNSVIYDRVRKGYRLDKIDKKDLLDAEVLAVCKILLDSRAFTKEEMQNVIEKLVGNCTPKESLSIMKALIDDEMLHYVETQHKTKFMDILWMVEQAVRNGQYIEVEYQRGKDKTTVKRKLMPVTIMFSEFYFYLTAFIYDENVQQTYDVMDDAFPIIYRIDRIKSISVLNETFPIPYNAHFEESEFRKRIQFMYGGKLHRVKFKYSGPDIEAVLDRLPTAQILSEEDGIYIINAEVYGKGIDMWFRSQGEFIERL